MVAIVADEAREGGEQGAVELNYGLTSCTALALETSTTNYTSRSTMKLKELESGTSYTTHLPLMPASSSAHSFFLVALPQSYSHSRALVRPARAL